MLTQAIAGLCAVIDQGDDEVLSILADALEDAGDPRAAGLRRFAHRPALEWEARPCSTLQDPRGGITAANRIWGWFAALPASAYVGRPGGLVPAVFSRLRENILPGRMDARYYPTRSAAYLALAEALLG